MKYIYIAAITQNIKSVVASFTFPIISYRARATHTYENLILQKMDILISDEVGYFEPADNKLSSLRLTHMLKITNTQL
jgi:pyridoxal biosynthesis lyase PdxS